MFASRRHWGRCLACCVILGSLDVLAATAAEPAKPKQSPTEWKAGTATAKITPAGSMWMAGYAARKKPSEGVAQDLFAKALAIEDGAGRRAVIVTLDLIGVRRVMRDEIAERCASKYGLDSAALLINASHTHCGPEFRASQVETATDQSERAKAAADYANGLKDSIVEIVGKSLDALAPARLDYLHARAGFAMNRRRPTANGVQNAPNSAGPVDHNVPVLRVTNAAGELRALLFGYTCHNTTLSFYQFCGDYAGFAQQYLEEEHPGVTVLFMNGCSGDQNPYPRGTIELCRQHGRTLATAVDAALETVPKPITGPLATALEDVELEFAPPPSREELMKQAVDEKSTVGSHARKLLKQLDEQGSIKLTYTYPIQVVHFGQSMTLIALAGETVVDYSLRLKRELADQTVWMAGYSNDVFGYVPSLAVLQGGGYEGGGAMLHTSLPGPFAPSVEERIVAKTLELARRQPKP